MPNEQLGVIRKGLLQYEQALKLLREITDINLALMRAGVLEQSLKLEKQGEQR